jgi:hypothetical protein
MDSGCIEGCLSTKYAQQNKKLRLQARQRDNEIVKPLSGLLLKYGGIFTYQASFLSLHFPITARFELSVDIVHDS